MKIKSSIKSLKWILLYSALFILLILANNPSYADSLSYEQKLGSFLFRDKNLSLHKNQSCASCHSLHLVTLFNDEKTPTPAFVDPENVATGSSTSRGSISGAIGALNTPSIGYASFNPDFHFNTDRGLWLGGQFWNGRASNLVEQAKGPFLNPVEMAMPDRWSIIDELKANPFYVKAFRYVYDFDLQSIPYSNQTSSDENAPETVFTAYNLVAKAIASYETSRRFNSFTSKYDFVEAGITQFSAEEIRGKALFEGDAKCSLCHTTGPSVDNTGKSYPAVFTDFTYFNIGIPRNTGIPGNPSPDIGLGATTGTVSDNGKHKVMSLRNITLTAPYGHNGYFKSLEQIVHFYNTRDIPSEGWAKPEIAENMNTSVTGNLGLSRQDEADIVAFLSTLTDNYQRWGNDSNVPQHSTSPW